MNQLTDQLNPAICQRVNIVGRFLGVIKTDNFADDGQHILHLQGAVGGVVRSIKAEPAIELEATNPRTIVAAIIKEGALNHRLGVLNRSEIARAQPAIDFKQRRSLAGGGVFLQGGVDVANRAVVNLGKLGADFLVGSDAERAQEGGDGNLAAAINLDVDAATWGSLKLQPGTATGNYLGAVVALAIVFVSGKENPGGTNQLGNYHALGTVDNKGGALGHPGIVAEINVLLLDLAGDLVGQLHDYVQRGGVGGQVVFSGFLVLGRSFEIIILEAQG